MEGVGRGLAGFGQFWDEGVDGGAERVAALIGFVEKNKMGGVGEFEGFSLGRVVEVVVKRREVDGAGPEIVLAADDEGGPFDRFGIPILVAVRHVEAFAAVATGDFQCVLGVPGGGQGSVFSYGLTVDPGAFVGERDGIKAAGDHCLGGGLTIDGNAVIVAVAVGGVCEGGVEAPGGFDAIEGVEHDKAVDFFVVQGGVIADPMAAGGPAEQVDSLQLFFFPDIIHHGVDIGGGFTAGTCGEAGICGVVGRRF